jgi:hypothetical protein
MTFGDTRADGVRALDHLRALSSSLAIDRWPDEVYVPSCGPRHGLHRPQHRRR